MNIEDVYKRQFNTLLISIVEPLLVHRFNKKAELFTGSYQKAV